MWVTCHVSRATLGEFTLDIIDELAMVMGVTDMTVEVV